MSNRVKERNSNKTTTDVQILYTSTPKGYYSVIVSLYLKNCVLMTVLLDSIYTALR